MNATEIVAVNSHDLTIISEKSPNKPPHLAGLRLSLIWIDKTS
jgi:hypothetical protein